MFLARGIRYFHGLQRNYSVIDELDNTKTPYENMQEFLTVALTLQQKNFGPDSIASNFRKGIEIAKEIYPTRPEKIIKIASGISFAYAMKDDYSAATAYLEESIIYGAKCKKESESLSDSFLTIGQVYYIMNDMKNADIYLTKGLAGAALTDLHRKAMAYEKLGRVKLALNEFSAALEYCQEAVKILKGINISDSLLCICLETLGDSLEKCENHRANQVYFEVLQTAYSFLSSQPQIGSEELSTYLEICDHVFIKLFKMLTESKNYPEAVEAALDACKVFNFSTDKEAVMQFLQDVCEKIGYIQYLEPIALKMLQYVDEVYGETEIASVIYSLAADSLNYNGKSDEALKNALKGLAIRKKINDLESILLSYMLLSKIYFNLGDIEIAKSYIDLSQAILEKYPRRDFENEINYYLYLYYFNKQQNDLAIKNLELYLENTPEGLETAETLSLRYTELGQLLQLSSKLERALVAHKKALEVYQKYFGLENIESANIRDNIGMLLCANNDYEKSLEELFEAMDMKIKLVGENHSSMISTYTCIAATYFSMKEYNLTIENLLKANEIIKKNIEKRDIFLANNYVMIGEAYEKLMNRTKARSLFITAREIYVEIEAEDMIEEISNKIASIDL